MWVVTRSPILFIGRRGGVYIFLSLPFLINVPVGPLIIILHIPCQIQLWMRLSSPDPIPIHPGSMPIFFPMDMYSCSQCLCISFLHFSFTRRSLLSYDGLLPSLPDFLHRGISSFCILRKTYLKSCHLSSAALSLRAVSQGLPFTSSLKN